MSRRKSGQSLNHTFSMLPTLIRSAVIALALQGCLPMQSDDLSQFEIEPQKVYVWNGQQCIEAVRTQDQLSEMESLTSLVKRDGKVVPFPLFAENVPTTAIRSLFTKGGTIDLPSGEKLTFPPGTSFLRSAMIPSGQATLENGKTIHNDGGTFTGPLPEITNAT